MKIVRAYETNTHIPIPFQLLVYRDGKAVIWGEGGLQNHAQVEKLIETLRSTYCQITQQEIDETNSAWLNGCEDSTERYEVTGRDGDFLNPGITREEKGKRWGFVYLLKSTTGFWKIGRTKNPDNRIATFSIKLPFEVEYEALIETDDCYSLEMKLHKQFAKQRVNGEWFDLTETDVKYIKSLEELS